MDGTFYIELSVSGNVKMLVRKVTINFFLQQFEKRAIPCVKGIFKHEVCVQIGNTLSGVFRSPENIVRPFSDKIPFGLIFIEDSSLLKLVDFCIIESFSSRIGN